MRFWKVEHLLAPGTKRKEREREAEREREREERGTKVEVEVKMKCGSYVDVIAGRWGHGVAEECERDTHTHTHTHSGVYNAVNSRLLLSK